MHSLRRFYRRNSRLCGSIASTVIGQCPTVDLDNTTDRTGHDGATGRDAGRVACGGRVGVIVGFRHDSVCVQDSIGQRLRCLDRHLQHENTRLLGIIELQTRAIDELTRRLPALPSPADARSGDPVLDEQTPAPATPATMPRSRPSRYAGGGVGGGDGGGGRQCEPVTHGRNRRRAPPAGAPHPRRNTPPAAITKFKETAATTAASEAAGWSTMTRLARKGGTVRGVDPGRLRRHDQGLRRERDADARCPHHAPAAHPT
jgi:hypothetical protein